MISKVAAGGGAAALTAFAIGVSLRHGIFVAGLAFVGGFASPAIIGSETPNTPVLFGYLLAIAAGTLAVIRLRGWWPLGWGVLAGIGDLDAALDVVAGGRPALGRAVPGGRRRPVRLGDLAAVGRKRKPDRRRRAAGLGGARRHRRPDRGPDRPGQWQAECRLAGAGGAWAGPVRARPLDAALPVRCGPGAGPVGRRARPVVGRHAGHRAGLGQRATSPGGRSCSAASLPPAPSPCCGTRPGRASGRRSPSPRRSRTSCSAGTCCAASPPARRGA